MWSDKTVALYSPFRADSLRQFVFRCSVARRCMPRGRRAARDTRGASYAATATQYHAKLGFDFEDSGTGKDRTIHAFARSPGEGGGVLKGGLHPLFRLLFAWRTLAFPDSAAGLGGKVSRPRGKRQRQEMDSRIGVLPAPFPHHLSPQTATPLVLAS